MLLSHIGDFDCDSIRNAVSAQSPLSLRKVAEHGEFSANVFGLISTDVEQKIFFLIGKC